MKQNILDLFNQELGSDVNNLDKVFELKEKFELQRKKIEQSLSCTDTESPSKIAIAVQNADRMKRKVDEIVDTYERISKDICDHLDKTDGTRKKIGDHLEKIEILEITLKYLNLVQLIDSLSEKLEQAFLNKDEEQCVTLYANLCEVSRNLQDSSAAHLKQALHDVLLHWHNILRDVFSRDFEEVLKAARWPFVSGNLSPAPPATQVLQRLQLLAEYLLYVQLPEECPRAAAASPLLADAAPLSLPLACLVRPLRKRFIYHFYGARQTNRPDRPEWYFTQVLSWIRDHRDCATRWLQPVLDKLGLVHVDAAAELARGLVQLAVEKLMAELPALQFDDCAFSHCVDEALGFDRELREVYEYPAGQPGVLAVLTQAQVFLKWLSMERKYATEKVDAVLAAPDAFAPLASDVDDSKVTVCADAFVTLLQTIADRYEALPQPGHRLQFLDLQLELLDDFRVRLLQIHKHEADDLMDSRLPHIANTLAYVESVLLDWGTTVHYLHLHHYKTQFEAADAAAHPADDGDDAAGTVFDRVVFLYRRLRDELLAKLCEAVLHDVRARSRSYRNDRWATMPLHKDARSLSLAASACPMFEVLATRLHQLQRALAAQPFRAVWRSLAEQLDAFLYQELVLENRYNEGGAMQLKFDVTRNLLPLFAQFTDRPEAYFNKLSESCILLTLPRGSALLLIESIHKSKKDNASDESRSALEEMNITSTTPSEALVILNLRNDIVTFNDIIMSM